MIAQRGCSRSTLKNSATVDMMGTWACVSGIFSELGRKDGANVQACDRKQRKLKVLLYYMYNNVYP
jgi:hypothetical protein